jgi:4-hydroxybutyryl-CoA dehydratase/vinylacetyl-CoA-Delta-isomerase
MLNSAGYRNSLNDGRNVYFRGEKVTDVSQYPPVAATIEKIGRTYDRHWSGEVAATNALLTPPRSAQEFQDRLQELHSEDLMLHVTYQSLMALLTAAGRIEKSFPEGARRVRAYVEECRLRDIRMVQCITDSKGDRSKSAGAQPDPDQYLRVVERRNDGVIIRGAKLHISGAAIAHELMVMPTKRMKPGEEDYSIACGVPVNAPGVRIVSTMPDQPDAADPREFPLSWDRVLPEALIIFDDVFVPNDRICAQLRFVGEARRDRGTSASG